MEAKDLRIGNLINSVFDGVVIATPSRISIIDQANRDPKFVKEFEFIPLTEEWLLKFGCDVVTTNKDGSVNYWNKEKDFSIDIEHDEVFKYRLFERKRTKQVLEVHQLQNLYYALTGEELKLKTV